MVITVEESACRLEQGHAMTFNANLPHMDEPGFEVTDARALILIVVGK